MRKFRLPAHSTIWVPFVVVFLVFLLIMPRTAKFSYEYKKGQIWKYETLIADFDFPIYKTEEQIQEERSNSSAGNVPYFRYSEDVVNKNLKTAESLPLGKYKTAVVNALRSVYATGIMSDEGIKLDRHSNLSSEVIYVQKNKRATRYPVSEVYKQADAKAKLLADVSKSYPKADIDSLFKYSGVYELIVPNLVFDKQTTDLVNAESAVDVSPTQGFVNAGQLIVSNGEIVTAEIAQILDSYKYEYQQNMGYRRPTVFFWAGNILVALSLLTILLLVIFFTTPRILSSSKELMYVLFVFLISSIAAFTIGRQDTQYLFLVPFPLAGLYLQAFYKSKLIVPVYIVSILPLLIFTHAGPVLFVMFLVAGLSFIFAFRFFNRSWKQFIAAAISFVSVMVVYTGFTLIDAINTDVPRTIMYLFMSCVLCVLGYPLIFLFERVFNLVSNNRLEELTDTGSMLMRRLEEKAPGTFQHSLQVMSMAEYVARAVNANVTLVRAGALHHDIGKMRNPLCFIENESLIQKGEDYEPYHSKLTPEQSATAIISHMQDGVDLAEKYNLPDVIVDFIKSHHGTSRTAYFYNRYVNEGGDPSNDAAFTYPGVKPSTKEQIILMLCDTIEAASRTLKENTTEEYSRFVESMVEMKMNEGQFENADISIKELNVVKAELKSYLAQMHHGRVSYPKRKRL